MIHLPIENAQDYVHYGSSSFGFYWKDKRFGIDPILDRVKDENLLLGHDYQRIKSIVDVIYNIGTQVPDSDVIYLQRKNRDVERKDKTSFTHLYVLSVLKLVENLESFRQKNLVQLMPDLQGTNNILKIEDRTPFE